MKIVFLIDDDEDDREIFGEALASLDDRYHFQEAENGEHAFEKLDNSDFLTPDIIFLDLNMPKMGGREFLTTFKKRSQFSDIPVIIYSTSSNHEDIEFANKNGAAFFITKHHSIIELQRQLKETLTQFFGQHKK